MTALLAKTAAGQHEIRGRATAVARPARTLLVLADGTRSGEQLLGMVQGASAADLARLVDAGLIKGLRLSLKIEKAKGPDGLREVAQRFVAEVQKVKGDSASQMVRRALGMTT